VTTLAVAGPRSPATTSGQGPAAVRKTQPQGVTKYNEFYGGVRCCTYISWRVERAHLGRDAAGGRLPLGTARGKEATAAGAHSNKL